MPRPLWQLLMIVNNPDEPVELSCGECFALLEYDAEQLIAGAKPEDLRPSVTQHLSLCSSCQSKMVGWLEELEKQSKPPDE